MQIPYYSVSGIQIRYLKVIERSGYQALPWWVLGQGLGVLLAACRHACMHSCGGHPGGMHVLGGVLLFHPAPTGNASLMLSLLWLVLSAGCAT